VVDVDLEQFFDRVNHDVLMGRLEKRIGDRRVLRLIRRYLEAGMLANGVATERHEGTPQGGPLSPLTPKALWELDQWIRHRLRAIHLKQWKRGTTIFRELRARGLSVTGAATVARTAADGGKTRQSSSTPRFPSATSTS